MVRVCRPVQAGGRPAPSPLWFLLPSSALAVVFLLIALHTFDISIGPVAEYVLPHMQRPWNRHLSTCQPTLQSHATYPHTTCYLLCRQRRHNMHACIIFNLPCQAESTARGSNPRPKMRSCLASLRPAVKDKKVQAVSKGCLWCSVAETCVRYPPLTSSAPPSYARVCRSECRGEMPSKQRQRNRRTPFCPASFPSKVRKSLPSFSQVMHSKWSARNGS